MTVKPFGPHHCFIRSGSVKHFHTSSRGASSTREMTKSVFFVAIDMDTPAELALEVYCEINRASRSANAGSLSRSLWLDHNHPVHAKFVLRHAEARRKERLAKRHDDVSAIRESVEESVSVGVVLGIYRQREAIELWVAGIAPIGRH